MDEIDWTGAHWVNADLSKLEEEGELPSSGAGDFVSRCASRADQFTDPVLEELRNGPRMGLKGYRIVDNDLGEES